MKLDKNGRATALKLQAVLVAMGQTTLRKNKNVGVSKRTSERGVPHIVVKVHGRTYSVCWFWQRKFYRVFFPYPSEGKDQYRVDLGTPTDVSNFFLVESTRQ